MHRIRHVFAWLGGATFIAICLVVIAALVYRATIVSRLSGAIFNTTKSITATPKTYGVAYRAIKIDSHRRRLDAWTVDAGAGTPAVLLFNGNSLNRSALAPVQAYLFRHHVSSMAFDYSGFGTSTGKASIHHFDQDGRATWRSFVAWAHGQHPLFVLGYSLGTGVAMHDVSSFDPQPRGVIVYGAFSSARGLIGYIGPGIPKVLIALMPDVWDNVAAAARLQQPLLVVAGMNDVNVPPINGRQIALFAHSGSKFVLIPGAGHSGILDHGTPTFDAVWEPILAFIAKHSTDRPAPRVAAPAESTHAVPTKSP